MGEKAALYVPLECRPERQHSVLHVEILGLTYYASKAYLNRAEFSGSPDQSAQMATGAGG